MSSAAVVIGALRVKCVSTNHSALSKTNWWSGANLPKVATYGVYVIIPPFVFTLNQIPMRIAAGSHCQAERVQSSNHEIYMT